MHQNHLTATPAFLRQRGYTALPPPGIHRDHPDVLARKLAIAERVSRDENLGETEHEAATGHQRLQVRHVPRA
jgi:hypothetical protein